MFPLIFYEINKQHIRLLFWVNFSAVTFPPLRNSDHEILNCLSVLDHFVKFALKGLKGVSPFHYTDFDHSRAH